MIKNHFALTLLFYAYLGSTQNIGDFTSIKPLAQRPDSLVIPKTHTFQYLIKTGDSLSDQRHASTHFDFTGYIPINGSKEGWLSISSEKNEAEVMVLHLSLNEAKGLWTVGTSGKVNFFTPFVKQAISKVSNFCSGGVMPWGNVVVAEEVVHDGDSNKDGYEDLGWLVEIDPVKREIAKTDKQGNPQKLWAMGRMQHENICILQDQKTCYFGADSKDFGFIYKFVCKRKGDLSKGKLYVLKMNGDVNSTTGVWMQVPNATKEECNNTNKLATQLGATNFAGIEDVEVGPDGKIYFSAKYSGRVYRFKDTKSKTEENEVFVEDKMYDIVHEEGTHELDFHSGHTGADNLAFDGDGNLWIMNDGGNNGMWVANRDHTPLKPHLKLFAESPKGCEPTGITFSPDFKYLFISFQNAKANSPQIDKAGNKVIFNTSHAVVISRK